MQQKLQDIYLYWKKYNSDKKSRANKSQLSLEHSAHCPSNMLMCQSMPGSCTLALAHLFIFIRNLQLSTDCYHPQFIDEKSSLDISNCQGYTARWHYGIQHYFYYIIPHCCLNGGRKERRRVEEERRQEKREKDCLVQGTNNINGCLKEHPTGWWCRVKCLLPKDVATEAKL